jgi:hypothetical protein
LAGRRENKNKRAGVSALPDEYWTFYNALGTVTKSPNWDVGTARQALRGIEIGDGMGNRIQDLHLSLYGYGLGKMIRRGR